MEDTGKRKAWLNGEVQGLEEDPAQNSRELEHWLVLGPVQREGHAASWARLQLPTKRPTNRHVY